MPNRRDIRLICMDVLLDGTFARSINKENPLGTKGELAKAWAELLRVLWSEKYEFLSPMTFRVSLPCFCSWFFG